MTVSPPPTRLELKLAKWWLFSAAIVIFTVAADVMAAAIGPGSFNAITVFGGGDLFAASFGLSAAAAGDLICDRLFAPNPQITHLKWLGICLALGLFTFVAYFWTKDSLGLAAIVAGDGITGGGLSEVKDTAFWVAIASPTTCLVSAYVARQAVKRSEP